MNYKILKSRLFLAATVICILLPITGELSAEDIKAMEHGKTAFKEQCAVCHGEKGEGNGPAARFLFPKPRDLTLGVFKVRSTPTGEPPTDSDISNTIKNGMPGSSMPSFTDLPQKDLNALVSYVKKLGKIDRMPVNTIEAGNPPPSTPEIIAKGREIYRKVKCWECHGDDGKGDGPKADKLKDDQEQPSPPNAFTKGIYKGGGILHDIYLRFTTGMDGSPMPSYEDSLTNEERWAIVYHTLSLAGSAVAKQPSTGKIMARKVTGEIPDKHTDKLWKKTAALSIPLMYLWQWNYPALTIHVRAVHNEKEIAFLLEWQDDTKDAAISLDTFRDGAALQFPVSQKENPPSFWMGHGQGKNRAGIVNIWFWKADLQEDIESSGRSYRSPVENLESGGLGTLTLKDEKSQNVVGSGKWNSGRWTVLFKRRLSGEKDDVKFTLSNPMPVAFAVWNGAFSRASNTNKAVSTWYYVVLSNK